MPINEYVEDGLFQHRRVNDPDLANRTRKEGDVAAHAERLAQLRAAGDHRQARPARGARRARPGRSSTSARRPRSDEDGQPAFWENDADPALRPGRCCSRRTWASPVPARHPLLHRLEGPGRGPLRRRRCGPRRWRPSRLIRELSARDVAPEPLPAELRHRCFGCSLATVCLPEETLYLIHQPDAPEPPPTRRPTAAGDHLTRVIAAERRQGGALPAGARLARRQAQRAPGRHATTARRSTACRSPRSARSSSSATSRSRPRRCDCLAEAEVPVVYLTVYGQFIAAFDAGACRRTWCCGPPVPASSPTRQWALALAKAVVAAKIANQRTLLMRSLRSRPLPAE